MNKELEIWQFAAERLQRDETIMLLVVAESSGSSPGRQGFKMIVAHDNLCGSIGGGVMEVALVEKAKFQISDSKFQIKPEIVEQVHKKHSPNSSGMICSGKQTVILFKLDPTHLVAIEQIIECIENHYFNHLQIKNDSIQVVNLFRSSNPERRISKDSNIDFEYIFEKFDKDKFVYEELLGFKNKLFIVGGGHCALALSEIMSKMDFHISLFDDRADLNTLAKNKFVHKKKIIESYQNIGKFIGSGIYTYVVVMTLGYKFDEIVIRALIDKDFKYFGVLGSKAKMKTLLKSLENEGFDKARLNTIHTPIGLKINSRTPEEIAVSIAAEIIAVKNSA